MESLRIMMELNEQEQVRQAKVDELRAQGIEPYPARAERTIDAAGALARYNEYEASYPDGRDPEPVTVVGRVMRLRHMGRAAFVHIEDRSGTLQLYLRSDGLGEGAYRDFIHFVDLGDFVQAAGHLFRTRTGEVSVEVTAWRMLAKAITPPPEKWHGLTDPELRYRRRAVDLFSNAEVREIFMKRTRMVTAIRSFLDSQGFVEVETPTLQPVYGGALSKPFTTHFNALDQTLYLRIADELYLKRLIVGGLERVYEICKDFRNEGMDSFHNPEFTMLEFYMAYADYTHVMELTEQMMAAAATAATGSTTFTYGEHQIDMTPPFRRIPLADAVFETTGIDYTKARDQAALYELAKNAGADIPPDTVWPKIVDELLKQFVKPTLIQPAFLTDYPIELSPLAKRSPVDPHTVERFQLFVAGAFELCNAYTELNDPVDQYERFMEQTRQRDQGDDETMPIDMDYVEAMLYGMPPTGGFGIGIDRLAMLLTNQQSIREVILFPPMRSRPEQTGHRSAQDDV